MTFRVLAIWHLHPHREVAGPCKRGTDVRAHQPIPRALIRYRLFTRARQ